MTVVETCFLKKRYNPDTLLLVTNRTLESEEALIDCYAASPACSCLTRRRFPRSTSDCKTTETTATFGVCSGGASLADVFGGVE